MFKEFKQFAMQGNVVDMAIGIVIGAAFGAIIKSLVDDVIMPPIGLLLGDVDFANMFVVLKEGAAAAAPYASLDAAKKAGAVTLNYGVFINSIVSFTIVAFAIFMLIRTLNKYKQAEAAPAPDTKDCPRCYTAIPLKASRCPHCTSDL